MKALRTGGTLALITAALTSLHVSAPVAAASAPAAVHQNLCGRPLLVPAGIPFGDTVRRDDPSTGQMVVQAVCKTGADPGWSIRAVLHRNGSAREFMSPRPFPLDRPVAILALHYFAAGELPGVLAQVGVGMTGQPYELFTFDDHHQVVPAQMQVTLAFPGLLGGGATLHGQGVICGAHDGLLVITQETWDLNLPAQWVPSDGGVTPAPTDPVTVSYEEWRLGGQPLREVARRSLRPTQTIYKKAQALENAHC